MISPTPDNRFRACLAIILKHEGGFVNHPRDPGGATNRGVTLATLRDWRSNPNLGVSDIRALSVEEAGDIYRARYWSRVRADDLPAGLDLVAFDAAVNSGPLRAVTWLQQAIGAIPDGRIGPATVAAACAADTSAAVNAACDRRLAFLRGLPTFDVFGRGWSRRVAEVRAAALAMIR